MATRPQLGVDFGVPTLLDGIAAPNPLSEIHPLVRADGSELWFGSDRNGTDYNLYRAPRVGSSFANPVELAELDSTSTETSPVISADGLTAYWGTDRPDGNAKGGYDIWVATRKAKNEPFSGIRNVAELNLAGEDIPNWLSPDGCRLYFQSRRSAGPGGTDLYVAEHPK
jgi:Tol biopolymer transport system component